LPWYYYDGTLTTGLGFLLNFTGGPSIFAIFSIILPIIAIIGIYKTKWIVVLICSIFLILCSLFLLIAGGLGYITLQLIGGLLFLISAIFVKKQEIS